MSVHVGTALQYMLRALTGHSGLLAWALGGEADLSEPGLLEEVRPELRANQLFHQVRVPSLTLK